MVRVPEGTVELGDGRRERVGEFYITRAPISGTNFQEFIDQSDYFYPTPRIFECNFGKSDRSSRPVNCVTWEDASAFAKWAVMQLPTEGELRRAIEVASEGGGISIAPAEEWVADAYSAREKVLLRLDGDKVQRNRDIPSNGRYREDYTFRLVLRAPKI